MLVYHEGHGLCSELTVAGEELVRNQLTLFLSLYES